MKNKTDINQATYDLKNKIYLKKIYKISKIQGFTLVELMVAVTISIIVLLAASSTFIITYRLNQEVKTRIRTEQDIRNAADLLRTDARKLGDFRCQFGPPPNVLNEHFPGSYEDTKNKQFLSTSFDFSRFSNRLGLTPKAGNKPLLINYLPYANTNVAIIGSNCNKEGIPAVSASMYLVGTTSFNSTPGLYKVDYDSTLRMWSAPQLIVSNVEKMDLTFYYDKHEESDCPKTKGDFIDSDLEESTSGKIETKYSKPPILIKATLKVCPTEKCNDYVIQAMVRKGEVCS